MDGLIVRLRNDPDGTADVVSNGLRSFNRKFLGDYGVESIAVDVCNEEGEVLGGA